MDERPEVISSQRRFEGRVFTVRTDALAFSDGARHNVDIVAHGASYAIIALTRNDEIVLVRQYRHAVGDDIWEIPAGRAEPGESVLEGALRELAEETGFRARSTRELGGVAMTPGYCDEVIYFVHAYDLWPGEQNLDVDERITVASFPLERAVCLVEDGQIADAKTLIALQWMRGNRGELVRRRADN